MSKRKNNCFLINIKRKFYCNIISICIRDLRNNRYFISINKIIYTFRIVMDNIMIIIKPGIFP